MADIGAHVRVFQLTEGEIVIDRSRQLQKDRLAMTVLEMRLRKAQRDLDPDGFEQAWRDVEALMAKIIVRVPESWKTRGIDISTPGWLGELPTPIYDEIIVAITQDGVGSPKASAGGST